MSAKYIPFFPDPVKGQAILNFTRTLRYDGNDKVKDHLRRGMPLYEAELLEHVGKKGKTDNLVLRGECLSACAYLKDQGRKVDLVYIDPPFASGADYAKKIYLRRGVLEKASKKNAETEIDSEELAAFEEKMYGDVWQKERYLNWMYENLCAIRAVMSDNASIYVHLDWHIGHYVKIMMDEIFGEENFQNEIIWHYYNKMQGNVNRFASNHDVILVYSVGAKYLFNQIQENRGSLVRQIKRVWDKQAQKLVNAKDENGKVVYIETDKKTVDDVWRISMLQPADKEEPLDYATQKPEALLERIIKASSNEGMTVADFFGGSGVTAAVAARLGRKFIHADVGINSIETARDRLRKGKAVFDVMDVKDGIQFYRNPVQTMEQMKKLIPGLRNEDSISEFWEGAIHTSRQGMIPVYVPNLMDPLSYVLDEPLMFRILHEVNTNLPSGVKKVIVYYVQKADGIEKMIREDKELTIEVELRDLKEILSEVVVADDLDWTIAKESTGDLQNPVCVQVKQFDSDRVRGKIDEFNQRGMAAMKPGKPFKEIKISESGLELIELVSADCTSAKGPWNSDAEVKIDKFGFVSYNGEKTGKLWDGTLACPKNPLRIKVRNICGDESVFVHG